MKKFVLISFLLHSILGNVFLHNPRGSNNRLNEASPNRFDENRLFVSQNNAKGGYCWGPEMTYYEGSLLEIQYSGKSGCGNPGVTCDYIMQYMCTYSTDSGTTRIRDGTTTDAIPLDPSASTQTDANGDLLYGMHETYDYYQHCLTRDRNMGLFIADRETQGGLSPGRSSAIFTRQNNNGQRSGYECNEERDYYPYWHPSPWKDIAIVTDRTSFCSFSQNESQNVSPKGECVSSGGVYQSYNNRAACQQAGNIWRNSTHGIPAPDCLPTKYSESNSHGFDVPNRYVWTIPSASQEPCIDSSNCNCAFRIRYNVTSDDMGPNGNNPVGGIDYTKNGDVLTPVKQSETVAVDGLDFSLGINTDQFGRVFQDRSFIFRIATRPNGVSPNSTIFNLNVKGKRGNIVQAYPAVVYDFVPQNLYAKQGDYIHFQWTGCDTNPAGNAGEGRDGSDRSNIVQIQSPDHALPASDSWVSTNPLFVDPSVRARMQNLDQTNCLTYAQLVAIYPGPDDSGLINNDVRNCGKLNAASSYFDGGLVQMNTIGNFYYMSSRNNVVLRNQQKGMINVRSNV